MNDDNEHPGFLRTLAYLALIAVLWPIDKVLEYMVNRPLTEEDIAQGRNLSPWWGVWCETSRYGGVSYWKRQYTRDGKWVPLETFPAEAKRIALACDGGDERRHPSDRGMWKYTAMPYDPTRVENNRLTEFFKRRSAPTPNEKPI